MGCSLINSVLHIHILQHVPFRGQMPTWLTADNLRDCQQPQWPGGIAFQSGLQGWWQENSISRYYFGYFLIGTDYFILLYNVVASTQHW